MYLLNIDYWMQYILLPTFLRRPRWFAWLRVLAFPIKQLNQQVLLDREAALTLLLTTGQFIYLRKLINDRFDNALRRIDVLNDATTPGQYKIRIPIGLVTGTPLINLLGLAAKYTIAGNRFIVEYYI